VDAVRGEVGFHTAFDIVREATLAAIEISVIDAVIVGIRFYGS